MKVTAYVQPDCIWSTGVCSILDKYGIRYEKLDPTQDPKLYAELSRRTGQNLIPCVEIDGVMLVDTSAQEVEDYLLAHELVRQESTKAKDGAPSGTRGHIAGVVQENPTRFF